jgi:7-carboxy-7-deazaguanine synthase
MNTTASISTGTLPVMEHFYTIQGEGHHQGRAAYFIRLGGCDVGCAWCDVKDSWEAGSHPQRSIGDIMEMVIQNSPPLNADHHDRLVVITGGEPLMHDLGPLTTLLKAKGFRTNIETSGAHPLTGDWDWICLSPKKFKAPIPSILPLANELKVVVYNRSDFKWAEQWAALVSPGCKLFLQPEWEKAPVMTPAIIEYIKQHPQWQLSLQIHKYINVP